MTRRPVIRAHLALIAAIAVAIVPVVVGPPAGAGMLDSEPALTQLTDGGCCTRPFWSADSRQILFIDKPAPDDPAGIYGVDVEWPGPPHLILPRVAFELRGLSYLLDVKEGQTTIERTADGRRWTVPAGGAPVIISPNETLIAWEEGSTEPPERSRTTIRVAHVDGSDARTVATVSRGSITGWISESSLLVTGASQPGVVDQSLYALALDTGKPTELSRGAFLRGPRLSPDGRWVAFLVAPNPDPDRSGLWVMSTDGQRQFRVPPELAGSYQWRDEHRLLIIPFQPAAERHELWQADISTQSATLLVDSRAVPFKVAEADWVASPDGRKVVFVSAWDHNLWLMTLPD